MTEPGIEPCNLVFLSYVHKPTKFHGLGTCVNDNVTFPQVHLLNVLPLSHSTSTELPYSSAESVLKSSEISKI